MEEENEIKRATVRIKFKNSDKLKELLQQLLSTVEEIEKCELQIITQCEQNLNK